MAAVRKRTAQGVDALHQAILSQARGQARQQLHDAQLEVEAIQKQAQEESEKVSQEILAGARKEAEMEKQRRISAAQLEIHRGQLARREEQIRAVFAAAAERLEDLHHSAAYPEILRRLIAEAAEALGGGELIVLANEEDAGYLDGEFLAGVARELEQETALVLGDEVLNTNAGIIVQRADGHVRYNNTFAGRLERSRDLLRATIYRILSEGS